MGGTADGSAAALDAPALPAAGSGPAERWAGESSPDDEAPVDASTMGAGAIPSPAVRASTPTEGAAVGATVLPQPEIHNAAMRPATTRQGPGRCHVPRVISSPLATGCTAAGKRTRPLPAELGVCTMVHRGVKPGTDRSTKGHT